ncbi:MAG: M23 family metallopeptidase [Pseudomonadota bacterium]
MASEWVFGVLMTWLGFWTAGVGAPNTVEEVRCGGALGQGGLIVCQAPPQSRLSYDGYTVDVGDDGLAVFGIKRGAELAATIRGTADGRDVSVSLELEARNDPFRVIEGLECDKVDARTPEQRAHAGESWVIKRDAFATFHSGVSWADGFVRPAEGRPSSPFGPARKYIGVSAETGEACESVSVHRGYDIATPVGTPLIAPAGGMVILADPDLYYEGGSIFLDHGHGLVSVFMHLSSVDVAVGDEVLPGDLIGKTGNTGRTTGPHLHWAVKWRDVNSDDRGRDFYVDPALLLAVDWAEFSARTGTQDAGVDTP